MSLPIKYLLRPIDELGTVAVPGVGVGKGAEKGRQTSETQALPLSILIVMRRDRFRKPSAELF